MNCMQYEKVVTLKEIMEGLCIQGVEFQVVNEKEAEREYKHLRHIITQSDQNRCCDIDVLKVRNFRET